MKRFASNERGQALVEFSLALVTFTTFLFGIIDGGRLVYAWVAVGNAAREGGRTAIVASATDAEVKASIDRHAGLLGKLSTGTTITPSTRQSTGSVTVTVSWVYTGLTPVGQLFGNLTLTSQSTEVVE
jgi:Flp pilus assembly protein TadG